MSTKKINLNVNLMLSFIVFSMLLNSMSVIILQLSQNQQHSYTGLRHARIFQRHSYCLSFYFYGRLYQKKELLLSLVSHWLFVHLCSFTIPFVSEFWFLKIWFILIGISFSIGKICVFSLIKNISDNEKDFSKTMSRTEFY
jgi:hypothetical protein